MPPQTHRDHGPGHRQSDAAHPDGPLAGERISVQDTLYGLMLWSGNDAAEALAAALVPRERFLQQMNAKAGAMGLTDTHFMNPSGIDEDGHYSSPHDLALIAAYAYQHYPLLARVVSTKDYVIPATSTHKAFFPENFNRASSGSTRAPSASRPARPMPPCSAWSAARTAAMPP